MFDGIAGKYDLLNRVLSMGIDQGWRKKAIMSLAMVAPESILDVATGTGDLAIAAVRQTGARVTGIDISEGMLAIGRAKLAKAGLTEKVALQREDIAALPFPDNQFDGVMCAYGVRNFEHLEQGLAEMCRVLRPGGRLAILEFSKPTAPVFKDVFGFYFKNILPRLGNLISNHGRAYTYLNESAMAFPEGAAFKHILEQAGFQQVAVRPLTLGVTTLYTATK